MLHAFSRFEMLIGTEALEKLRNLKVAVFGVGGVGSFAAEGLVRSGVGKFMLVDDDLICLTNLNRQIHATRKTIGRPKVDVMKERIKDINPDAEVETYKLFYLPGVSDELISNDIDYIVDAIDTVTAKIDLVMKAREKGIPIISSMGTGNKLNPALLEITDISKTTVDPLARVMRRELRNRGITSLKVLFSREKPAEAIESEETSCKENCICPSGTERKCTDRRNIPGSAAFVPPSAGLLIASEVVRDIISLKD